MIALSYLTESGGATTTLTKRGSMFGKRKEGVTLRPRVRRSTPLVDLSLAVILGAVTGVYIFKDSMQRWQISENEYVAAELSKVNKATQSAEAVTTQDATRS